MNQEERETRRRKRILGHTRKTENIVKTCRHFGVSRPTFYLWRKAYQAHGDARLIKKKPIPNAQRRRSSLLGCLLATPDLRIVGWRFATPALPRTTVLAAST